MKSDYRLFYINFFHFAINIYTNFQGFSCIVFHNMHIPAAGNIFIQIRLTFRPDFPSFVGLSMMCYTEGKANKTCFGERQLSGLIGKLLY